MASFCSWSANHFTPSPAESDLMVIHIRATGVKDGRARTLQIDMLDYLDPATGFSAMERTTGFHMAIVAQAIGEGGVSAGAVPPVAWPERWCPIRVAYGSVVPTIR